MMINKSKDFDNIEKFFNNFTNINEIIEYFDEKIQKYRKEIDKNDLVKQSSSSSIDDKPNELKSKLIEKINKTRKLREELESFIGCNEIKTIFKYQKICQQRQILFDQFQLLDDYQRSFERIQILLNECKELMNKLEYYQARKNIIEANNLYEKLVELSGKFPNELPIKNDQKSVIENSLKKLNLKIITTKEEFVYDMIQLFKKNLYFQNDSLNNKTFHFDFLRTMTSEQYESYIDCILEERYDFIINFRNLFNQFNDYFIRKILENNCKVNNSLHDEIHLIDADDDVIENLENFIEIIMNLFTLNNQLKQSEIFKKFIGQLWSEQIFHNVIDYYFERFIPKSESKLQEFLEKLEQGKHLEMKLKSLGMIDNDKDDGGESETLRTYRDNIQNHFSTKLCQDFIIRMKRLLKNKPPPLQTITSEKLLENISLRNRSKFSDCLISDYMIDVKDLFEEMSALLRNCSKNLSLLLTETIYLVCELFIAISPYRYRTLIENDARENAIFHNNCLMFGHLMECLALTNRPNLDTLFELVPNIRNIGTKILMNQMRYHERIIYRHITNETFQQSLMEIVNETPRTDLRISSQSHFEFRESINNCLKYLNYLRCSFYQILSGKIYDKIMSTLLQILFKQFIESILSLNDISSLGSSHLYNEIDYFCKEIKLFLIDSEDVIYQWMKLNEINFLLKSSLLEILNRWSDGNGLLATYLKPDEVKHLIRALFQNNERRAKVLAKIK